MELSLVIVSPGVILSLISSLSLKLSSPQLVSLVYCPSSQRLTSRVLLCVRVCGVYHVVVKEEAEDNIAPLSPPRRPQPPQRLLQRQASIYQKAYLSKQASVTSSSVGSPISEKSLSRSSSSGKVQCVNHDAINYLLSCTHSSTCCLLVSNTEGVVWF